MQMTRHPALSERFLFYWSKLHAEQLVSGDDFAELRPTISILFVDALLFPDVADYHLQKSEEARQKSEEASQRDECARRDIESELREVREQSRRELVRHVRLFQRLLPPGEFPEADLDAMSSDERRRLADELERRIP